VDDFRVMVHIFMAVLIMGTLWRLMSYHFIASKQPHLNHLGQAMATQYLSERVFECLNGLGQRGCSRARDRYRSRASARTVPATACPG
jgi:hypothetical protein